MKFSVYMAYDTHEDLLWFVDSIEKLPHRIARVSLNSPIMRLERLKEIVTETEQKKQDCVVDVEGWLYDSRRARGLGGGLFPPDINARY